MDCLNLERDGMATDNHTPNNFHLHDFAQYYSHMTNDCTRCHKSSLFRFFTSNYLLPPVVVEVMEDRQ